LHKSNLVIAFAECAGTFGLIVFATGSIVYNEMLGGVLGIGFISVVHFVGLSVMIFLFGRYSMAHFNPAVTIAFFIAKYITLKQIIVYVVAQTIGAFLGIVFVKYVLGNFANLGLNYPNYNYPTSLFFGVEVFATALLMASVFIAISIKGLPTALASSIIAGTVALDVFFFGSISGASMNPIRSLAPAVFTEMLSDLWLYWSAPFIGSIAVALIFYKIKKKKL
jgi:aquaporin Z